MNVELRRLSPDDGTDVYEMLQEIPERENGFGNNCNGKTYAEFKVWLKRCDDVSRGIGLEEWQVPQETYWLFADGLPVGMSKLRLRLTESLREEGGHIGYAIRPSQRGKGYGTLQLQHIVQRARKIGIGDLLITVYTDNIPSTRTALANGGRIVKSENGRHYIWIYR